MKSERRHELQHNQLADALEVSLEKSRPYGRLIAGLVILGFAGLIAFSYISAKGSEKIAAGWDEYFAALNTSDRTKLNEVAEKYAGTPVAATARVVSADLGLAQGCGQLFIDKAEAREVLQQSIDAYLNLQNDGSPSIKERALYGLGRAHEALGTIENLDKARDDYKKLIDTYPNGVYTSLAKARLADLDRNSIKKFYDWFASYQPAKPQSPLTNKPSFLEDTLDNDVSLPSAAGDLDPTKPLDKPADKSEEKPAATLPETPLLPTLDSAPATETPATDKPSSETTPSADKPAAETPATPSTEKPE